MGFDRSRRGNKQRAVGATAMSVHEEISARWESHYPEDLRALFLTLSDHIDTLERKVEQLERFLPHHLKSPTVPRIEEDDIGRL